MNSLIEITIKFFFTLFEKSKVIMVLIILAIWIASSTAYMPVYLYEWTKIQHIIIQNQDGLRVSFLISSLIIVIIIIPLYFQWVFKNKSPGRYIKKTVKDLTYDELFCLSAFFFPKRTEIVYLNENNLVVIGLKNKGILVMADIGIKPNKTLFQISPLFKPYLIKEFNKIKKQMDNSRK